MYLWKPQHCTHALGLDNVCPTLRADLRTVMSPGGCIQGSPSTWTGTSQFMWILIWLPCTILIADLSPLWILPRWTTPWTPTTSSMPSQWFGFVNFSSFSGPQMLAPEPQLMMLRMMIPSIGGSSTYLPSTSSLIFLWRSLQSRLPLNIFRTLTFT